jgi:Domain of unknown function (DU1801)
VAEAKTKRTDQSVSDFIDGLADESRRRDCAALARLMAKAAGAKGAMYGSNIVGFGSYQMEYASGRTGDWPAVAFSPRKADLTLYVSARTVPAQLLKRLGKHKVSGSCLHIKRLSDVDLDVLAMLVSASVKATKKKGGPAAPTSTR